MVAYVSHVWRPVAWLVSVGLLAGGLMLSGLAASADAQFWPQPTSQPAGLQRLVEELSAQLWYSCRGKIPEHRLRHDQLAEAIGAWNASSQNAADRQLMVQWLNDAMRASMPGSNKPMPPKPQFAGSPAIAPAESEPKSATGNEPVVTESHGDETQSMPTEAAASEDDGESGATEGLWFDESTESEPAESAPTELPSDGDPFGNDPLGI